AGEPNYRARRVENWFDGYIEMLLAAAVGDLYFMTRAHPGFQHPLSDFGAVSTLFSFEDVTRRLAHDFARRARNLRVIDPGIAQVPVLVENRNRRILECHPEPLLALPQGLLGLSP